jgi:hypothetical protein
MQNLILLELNEVMFPYVERYIKNGRLPHFRRMFDRYGYSVTNSEHVYSHLEPWIQWVSAHTGLSFDSHKIFRLGDMVGAQIPQVFEILEQQGISVGAVSPMNAENRLRNAAFFLPDPWTRSSVTGAPYVKRLYEAIANAVNENASGTLSLVNAWSLIEGLLRHGSIFNGWVYLNLALSSRRRPWRRALFLDLLMSDVFLSLWKRKKPQFGLLFLNAAAHVQHHYLYSSESYTGTHRNPTWYVPQGMDPVLEIYTVYDRILGQFSRIKPDARLLVATGLSQEPYPSPVYYYRLLEHGGFLKALGIRYQHIEPRMSRDFLVEFATSDECRLAQRCLESVKEANDVSIFEVDNRGTSLFVTLAYDKEITRETALKHQNGRIENFLEHVAFVAIKNGHHVSEGYFVDTAGSSDRRLDKRDAAMPVTDIFRVICNHFRHEDELVTRQG